MNSTLETSTLGKDLETLPDTFWQSILWRNDHNHWQELKSIVLRSLERFPNSSDPSTFIECHRAKEIANHVSIHGILSDKTIRKFTDIVIADEWEVETDTGWAPIKSINKTIPYEVWRVHFSNGEGLECADTHILIKENGDEIYAKDSLTQHIKCNTGIVKVVKVEKTDREEEMYDLSVDSDAHTYYTNGVLSHNSITTAACVLWYLLFQENKTVAILANKGATAREILGRIQLMYENLPNWMQVGVTNWNKGSFSLGNGNSIIASSTSSSAIRGQSLSWVICDEFAFVPNNVALEFFESVYPTISSGKESKFTMFSTPKGLNHFYKFWMDAKNGVSEFVPFETNWNDVPGRDEEWRKKMIATIGEDSWLQEFNAEFLSASGTLISSSKLSTLVAQPPLRKKGDFRVYEEPKEDRIYFATVDVAHGGGGDYSTIQVIDVTEKPYKQVACYACNSIDYVRFEDVIYDVCRSYRAKCLIEANDLGEPVVRDLWENLEFDDLLSCDGKALDVVHVSKKQFGLRTTGKTKRIGCNNLKLLIENDALLLNDADTINELTLFTQQNGSYRAEEGFHDDLVMGLVLFAVAAQCDNFNDYVESGFEWKKELHAEEDFIPFGFFDDGTTPPDETPIDF